MNLPPKLPPLQTPNQKVTPKEEEKMSKLWHSINDEEKYRVAHVKLKSNQKLTGEQERFMFDHFVAKAYRDAGNNEEKLAKVAGNNYGGNHSFMAQKVALEMLGVMYPSADFSHCCDLPEIRSKNQHGKSNALYVESEVKEEGEDEGLGVKR